ncbi:hypothetical protein BDV24DRAFT_54692 [Aspergillus arachidicola]|uniref:Uncharacterized protein n=1 Tax=Aspergillus arachidicola TaxID=656916 RepID=A0A5N6Y752_9EURO|nr:hypothetical protein BDV24DRAFT_54692 [Aspergillus arachidicola]
MTRRSDNAVGRFGHPIHGTLNILCGEILGEQQPRLLLIPLFFCFERVFIGLRNEA